LQKQQRWTPVLEPVVRVGRRAFERPAMVALSANPYVPELHLRAEVMIWRAMKPFFRRDPLGNSATGMSFNRTEIVFRSP
jgi:hypothetical protein